METKIKEIVEWIKDNYTSLPLSNIDGKNLVIFATGDFTGEYGYGSSDLEAWGVDESGKLFWAYASGCSCYCNAGVSEMTMKVFGVEIPKENSDTNLLAQIGLFEVSKEKFRESISVCNYTSY